MQMFKHVLFHQVRRLESDFQEVWILILANDSRYSEHLKGVIEGKTTLHGFIEFFLFV